MNDLQHLIDMLNRGDLHYHVYNLYYNEIVRKRILETFGKITLKFIFSYPTLLLEKIEEINK